MAIGPEKVRLQVIVSKETAAEIEELAAAMNASTSRMAARLLEEAIKDNAWIIKNVAGPVRRFLDRRERQGKAKPANS